MTAQKRKIFRIALIFMLCLCAFASPAYAKTKSKKTKVYKIKTAADWKNISKKNGGSFKLTKDIRLSSTKQYLIINKNKKYTIDLNGHKVYTTYAGAVSRTTCPLEIKKGTVILKSSKKNKGVLYSTETSAVTVEGKAKFYLKSGAIVNDAVEFRSDVIHGLCLTDSAKGYIQNDAKIMSIGSGIIMIGKSRLYTSGHPFIRAGVSTLTGMFTHYGCGIAVISPNCKLSLKGGSFGTKATPDTVVTGALGSLIIYTGSGDYPVMDKSGKVLKIPSGYKCVDAKGANVPVLPSNLSLMYPAMAYLGGESKLETWQQDSAGYYTVFILKK